MSETVIPTVLLRRGDIVQLYAIPEHMPGSLSNFPWPKEYLARLKAAGKIYDSLLEAHHSWVEAHEEWQDVAPAADQADLEEAIRAGEPDPGTPHTTAAERAEHVAWTRLQLAITDAQGSDNLPKSIVGAYLKDQVAHLAAHELARKQAHVDATRQAAEIMATAEDGSNSPGRASSAMKQYVAARWNDADDVDNLLITKDGDYFGNADAVRQHNDAILARWKREAQGQPEPEYDPSQAKTTELAAAAEYGSTEAKTELTRRKNASAGAVVPS